MPGTRIIPEYRSREDDRAGDDDDGTEPADPHWRDRYREPELAEGVLLYLVIFPIAVAIVLFGIAALLHWA